MCPQCCGRTSLPVLILMASIGMPWALFAHQAERFFNAAGELNQMFSARTLTCHGHLKKALQVLMSGGVAQDKLVISTSRTKNTLVLIRHTPLFVESAGQHRGLFRNCTSTPREGHSRCNTHTHAHTHTRILPTPTSCWGTPRCSFPHHAGCVHITSVAFPFLLPNSCIGRYSKPSTLENN